MAWLFLMASYFLPIKKATAPIPQYVWMWSTGILFFLLTFIEQNLWNIPWFRLSYIKEVTVQWKANGAMVGAWNQMIYGTALYIMVKISGDGSLAHNKKSYIFYFIGFANLMLNWGHHIYNLPNADWVRNVSYAISMTEWFVYISIIRGFRHKLAESRQLLHLLSYRFVIASEFWVFLNLFLALLMSIPAINRYTHGTHITVAHAMGTTIGINTMILLGSLGYIIGIEHQSTRTKKTIEKGFWIVQSSLCIFWFCLIAAGAIKGYMTTGLVSTDFQAIMDRVNPFLFVSSIAGLGLVTGFVVIIYAYFGVLHRGARVN
jgi:nitric oxide reductase subunit B